MPGPVRSAGSGGARYWCECGRRLSTPRTRSCSAGASGLSGRRFPKTIGLALAGEVAEMGISVERCRPGDSVFGFLDGFSSRRAAEGRRMTSRPGERNGKSDPNLFIRFSRSFPSSAKWRAYFVRWERHARVRRWLVRIWIEVPGNGRASVRIFLARSFRGAVRAEDQRAFERLRDDLEGLGYEVLPSGSFGRFVKWFRPTGALLFAVRRELEARFWSEKRTRRPPRTGSGGVAGALHRFARAPAWEPAACGWECRFKLGDGTETQLVLLVDPCGEGGRLAPEPMVLIYPPRSATRDRLRQLRTFCRAAGYEGKFETARPRGREPFLFGHFQKDPLSFEATAGERARLDELARAIQRLRQPTPQKRARVGSPTGVGAVARTRPAGTSARLNHGRSRTSER